MATTKEKSLNATSCIERNVLKLNVGGVRYETLRETICQYPETLLAKTFSSATAFGLPPEEEDGYYFFDRNGGLFEYILDFYRTGKLFYTEEDDVRLQDEYAYWGIVGEKEKADTEADAGKKAELMQFIKSATAPLDEICASPEIEVIFSPTLFRRFLNLLRTTNDRALFYSDCVCESTDKLQWTLPSSAFLKYNFDSVLGEPLRLEFPELANVNRGNYWTVRLRSRGLAEDSKIACTLQYFCVDDNHTEYLCFHTVFPVLYKVPRDYYVPWDLGVIGASVLVKFCGNFRPEPDLVVRPDSLEFVYDNPSRYGNYVSTIRQVFAAKNEKGQTPEEKEEKKEREERKKEWRFRTAHGPIQKMLECVPRDAVVNVVVAGRNELAVFVHNFEDSGGHIMAVFSTEGPQK